MTKIDLLIEISQGRVFFLKSPSELDGLTINPVIINNDLTIIWKPSIYYIDKQEFDILDDVAQEVGLKTEQVLELKKRLQEKDGHRKQLQQLDGER